MSREIAKIVLIGSGNVAWNISREFEIFQCYGRDPKRLCDIKAEHKTSLFEDIIKDADLYLIAVTDDVIEEISEKLALNIGEKSIVAHTSGTKSIDFLSEKIKNRAVFYPLQTFKRGKQVSFKDIPILIECKNEESELKLLSLARKHTSYAEVMDSHKRKMLHISAVFVCNFSNRLYSIAQEWSENSGVPFEILKPLMIESMSKVIEQKGLISELQTGPAIREDMKTITSHLNALDGNKEMKDIYKLLTESIINSKK